MSIASSTVLAYVEPDEALYPSGDGKPMAETAIHVQAIMLAFQAFEDFLEDQTDVYIGANMFWYYEEGNSKARRAPDVMVIKGVPRRRRRSFFSWLENGAVPSVIVEVVSPKKRRRDLQEKPVLYARLGVHEYFCFDPDARNPKQALRGWRLNDEGVFETLELDDLGRLFCQQLGLFLKAEGTMLRLIDAATGKPVMTRAEQVEWAEQRALAAKKRNRAEKHRADAALARADAAQVRADTEKARAEAEKARAEAEKARADALERELARFKAEKGHNGGGRRRNGN